MNSQETQPYIYRYPFSPRLLSHPGSKAFWKAKWRKGGPGYVVSSCIILIGLRWDNQVMSQGLTSSLLRSGGYCSQCSSSTFLPFDGGFSIQKKSGNQHHILLTRCFREELKRRIWGKRSVWEGPIGSCSFLLLQVTFVLIKGVCWFLCFINQKNIGLTKMFVLFGFCVKYFGEPNT